MGEKIQKWLFDIKMAIDEINGFLQNEEMDFPKYRNHIMLKRAVERNFEIIGEAINRIITFDPSFIEKITDAKSIVGLRNQVIHAYDNLSDEIIWSILINHLPKLKKEIDDLILSGTDRNN